MKNNTTQATMMHLYFSSFLHILFFFLIFADQLVCILAPYDENNKHVARGGWS